MFGVMITNGGPHPADYHAEVTAAKIVVVSDEASGEVQNVARAFRKNVEAILVDHHQAVEDKEKEHLSNKGGAHYSNDPHEHEYDATDHVDDETVQKIAEAARGTVLESHFAKPEVQNAIRDILHHETRSQMRVHASWHHDEEQRRQNKPRLAE